eukprot:Gregarina_sp_Poly_1__4012@NODE_2210_length_2482_cov_261_133333_g1425_i0_p1_GENE_NODE_2210_length_2482_cov_261_133333_g1425_i0NODE_2210_length_2482_cov_261_133333_g1425_i0_p1_ORF_typecomplete_len384_score61_60DEAD/PF00270_29/1_4e31DEAD/PF00270_29/9e02DEAD/PF00270_29/3_1e03Helicase_C/PF00271_31/1_4e03Helicase_C/PF00271_31/7_7e26Helicase_C/PF00271_31/1_1e04ResIII/PF04851_15/2_4e11ResIII/PF04851_15/2e03ERCC3_RAD25_C/PF16203_5/9_1e02ERCC3_RAD25_C/PF16203_5/5_5e03ERCC3_RAD25_C/PF16203_5/2_2e07AAA_19/P
MGSLFLASAPTGSGKTIAFLLPLIHSLKTDKHLDYAPARALVVTPTKELAQQIFRQLLLLQHGVKDSITAGTLSDLVESGAELDLVVCTPGVAYKLDEKPGILSGVRTLILDEADELLSSSFAAFSDKILSECHKSKQVVMFSATLPLPVLSLAASAIHTALVIQIGVSNSAPPEIEQELIDVCEEPGKLQIFRQLIEEKRLEFPLLIFVQEKERAAQLELELVKLGFRAGGLHSGLNKAQRETNLRDFRMGRLWILISTDVMARGIDCFGIQLVLNWDFPTSREAYIHRIGRTGRAGSRGKAITFFTDKDRGNLHLVVSVLRQSSSEVPEHVKGILASMKVRKSDVKRRRSLVRAPPRRSKISTQKKGRHSPSDKLLRDTNK